VRDHTVQHNNPDKLSSKELLDDVDPIAGIAKLNGTKQLTG
jgi:hypothetical protein